MNIVDAISELAKGNKIRRPTWDAAEFIYINPLNKLLENSYGEDVTSCITLTDDCWETHPSTTKDSEDEELLIEALKGLERNYFPENQEVMSKIRKRLFTN